MSKTVAELWKDIFNDYDILNHINRSGYFDIKATTIKEYKEPRLMTKFDFSSSLPEVFIENKLGILPIDNGTYRIGKFQLYEVLPTNSPDIEEVEFPENFETIDPDNVYSEANALHIAVITGMFKNILNEEVKQTISGRMRTSGFSFYVDRTDRVDKMNISIKSPQIEIDGGYEGDNNVLLVEAKNTMPKDFIVRQLYYPFRYWNSKVSKPIATFFFVYDSGLYHVYNYKFNEVDYYNSLELQSHRCFAVKYSTAEKTLKKIIRDTKIKYTDINSLEPFPQANTMNRVFQTLYCLNEKSKTAVEIAEVLGLDKRQGSYYGDACRYLHLAVKNGTKFELTDLGKSIIALGTKRRNQEIAKAIIEHKAFNDALKYAIKQKEKTISTEECERIMRANNVLTTDQMYRRRASTVKGWITWIVNSNM